MNGWYTDNLLSHTVMKSLMEGKQISTMNWICEFGKGNISGNSEHVFYGILRGCSRAMHFLKQHGVDYYYIDNGYFDALYVDKSMHKSMEGKFRVVKNGMHEVYPYEPDYSVNPVNNVVIIPPSPYSANFYDTTPEDWTAVVTEKIKAAIPICNIKVRSKQSILPLDESLRHVDAVIAFNSMAVIRACELDIPAFDTHGIFRNFDKYFPNGVFYDINKLRVFYEPKQFTLEEFKQGKCQWN